MSARNKHDRSVCKVKEKVNIKCRKLPQKRLRIWLDLVGGREL